MFSPIYTRKIIILCCGHSSAFNFDRIFFILGSNKNGHNVSDEFEFQPDPTLDCRVELIRDIVVIIVTCKNEEDSLKNIDVRVATTQNIDFSKALKGG